MPVPAETLDPRCHPYRPDLAAEELRGRVAAQRYAPGELRQVAHGATALLKRPDAGAAWASEALFGELVTIYEQAQGWAWGQLRRDGYVGYLSVAALSTEIAVSTHRVDALGTFLYPTADIKAAPLMSLSMNAAVAVAERDGAFARLVDGRFVPARHLATRDHPARDFVAVATAFLGVPYLWGGKTRLGVDCSGLLQLALHAGGHECPRDSDMQRALGTAVAVGADLAELVRGDLVFWQGHVGMMADAATLLHANAHHMAVVLEPLAEVVARQQQQGSPLAAIRRLVSAVAGAGGA
jgi:cell wall-associated NlpC family hydrolase